VSSIVFGVVTIVCSIAALVFVTLRVNYTARATVPTRRVIVVTAVFTAINVFNSVWKLHRVA